MGGGVYPPPNTGQGVDFQPDWMQKWRQIYNRADEEIRRRKEAMLTTEIFKASVIGIISGLVKSKRIIVPGKPYVRGIDPRKIHIYFENSPDVITCSLEKIEERLIKKYGK